MEGEDALEKSLARCEEITTLVVKKLDSFETRLTEIQDNMEYVHSKTEAMTTKRTHISQVISQTEKYFTQFRVPTVEADTITKGLRTENRQYYLESVGRVNQAIKFFEHQKDLKSTPKLLLQLTKLRDKAGAEIQGEFSRITAQSLNIIDIDSKVANYKNSTVKEIESIPAENVKILSELVEALYQYHHGSSFLKDFSQSRKDVLEKSFSKFHIIKNIQQDNDFDEISFQHNEKKITDIVKGFEIFMSMLQAEKNCCIEISENINPIIGMQTFLQIIETTVDDCIQKMSSLVSKFIGTDKTYVCFIMLESRYLNGDIFSSLFSYHNFDPRANRKESKERSEELESIHDWIEQKCVKYLKDFGNVKELFENSLITSIKEVRSKIETHSVKNLPAKSTVHQLTSNVLQYLKMIVSHKKTIDRYLKEIDKNIYLSLLRALLTNLHNKVKGFKHKYESDLFMLNNVHHILTAVKVPTMDSTIPLISVVGDEFVTELSQLVEQLISDYIQATFEKCLEFLLDKNANQISFNLSRSDRGKIKDKFSGFNTSFETIYGTQREICVPDATLRADLRLKCQKFLIPIYQNFIDRYTVVNFTKNLNKYLKYQPSTVESMINDFFEEDQ